MVYPWESAKWWLTLTRIAEHGGFTRNVDLTNEKPNGVWKWWSFQRSFFFGSYVLNHHIWGRPIRQIHGVWWGFVQPQVLVEFGWRNAHVFIVRSTPRLDMVGSFWIPLSVGSPSLWHRCVVFRLCQHWCDSTICSKIFGVIYIYIYGDRSKGPCKEF